MDDAEAYIALARNNMQGELHPLEIGLHALKSGLSVREYAKHTGRKAGNVQNRREAAEVAESCSNIATGTLQDRWLSLAETHSAPRWLWPALVAKLQAESWTVETTRKNVQTVSEAPEPPTWADWEGIASAMLAGTITPKAITKMDELAHETFAALAYEDLIERLSADLADSKPSQLSQVLDCCNGVKNIQAERERQKRE